MFVNFFFLSFTIPIKSLNWISLLCIEIAILLLKEIL